MAIRKSAEEEFVVSGTIDNWTEKCRKALEGGGFKSIKHNQVINQFEAKYKTFTVAGDLAITLLPGNGSTTIKLKSTGNMDNIYALFKSPNSAILSSFKDNLSRT